MENLHFRETKLETLDPQHSRWGQSFIIEDISDGGDATWLCSWLCNEPLNSSEFVKTTKSSSTEQNQCRTATTHVHWSEHHMAELSSCEADEMIL